MTRAKNLRLLLILICLTIHAGCVSNWDKARDAYLEGDYATALCEWRPLAERGDAVAQYSVGRMYRSGQGVARDDKEAVKWYRRAAEQGDAFAQYNLGVAYANEKGVPRNDKEAVKWLRLAAEQNLAEAQNILGMMYAEGRGVAQDKVQARMWYDMAAVRGQDDVREYVAENKIELEEKMRPADIAEAKRRAGKCRASNYKDC